MRKLKETVPMGKAKRPSAGNIMPPSVMPKFRVSRLVIRAQSVFIRAKDEQDALNRVSMGYAEFRHWKAHGEDGNQIGDMVAQRVIAHRKSDSSEQTTLAAPVARPHNPTESFSPHTRASEAPDQPDTEGGAHD